MTADHPASWPSRMPVIGLIVALGLTTMLRLPLMVVPVVLAVLVLWVLARAGRRVGARERGAATWVRILVVLGLCLSAVNMTVMLREADQPELVVRLLVCAVVASGVAAVLVDRAYWAFLVINVAVLVLVVTGDDVVIDVRYFVADSVAALTHGHNPYALSYPNPYSPALTREFWAPEFIDGDRITVGFPYLPGVLVGYLPGYLLGEVRLVSVAAVVGVSVLARRLATEPVGRLLAVSVLAPSLTSYTVVGYWVEPLLALAVAVLVWAMVRGRAIPAVIAVALFLSIKQYVVVTLPLEVFVRRGLGARALLWGVAVAVVLVIPLALVDVPAWKRAVIDLHLAQPYRADSISLTVHLAELWRRPPDWVFAVAPIGAGLAASFWVRVKAPVGPAWLAVGIGVSVLSMVLLAKQAHLNYFFLAYLTLIMGAVVWPREIHSSELADCEP